eukprot:s1525_g33.t1
MASSSAGSDEAWRNQKTITGKRDTGQLFNSTVLHVLAQALLLSLDAAGHCGWSRPVAMPMSIAAGSLCGFAIALASGVLALALAFLEGEGDVGILAFALVLAFLQGDVGILAFALVLAFLQGDAGVLAPALVLAFLQGGVLALALHGRVFAFLEALALVLPFSQALPLPLALLPLPSSLPPVSFPFPKSGSGRKGLGGPRRPRSIVVWPV